MSITFHVLPGLPTYGLPSRQFSVSGRGMRSEGFVVEFGDEGETWVGNFQRGTTGFDTALEHPDGRSVMVISGGQGYVVDPRAEEVTARFGGAFMGVMHTGTGGVVYSTSTDLVAYGPAGCEWRTRRLSWDGFRSLRIDGDTLHGEGWTFAGDGWIEFSLQLATGEASGGAYP